MTNGLFSLFSSLIANTPPYRKGLSSRKFLSLFLILFLAVGNAWGQEVVLFNTNFTNWETSPKENTGLSDGNTYTLTDGTNAVATLVGKGCKLNDTKNLPTSTGIEGYNTNKFRFGSEGNYVYITPNKEFNNGGKIRILVSAEKTKTTDILGTVVVGDESLGNLHGWTAKAMCDWQEFEVPETISGIAQIKITRTANTMFIWGIEVLTNSSAPAGGADPVCPETLTITSKDSKTAFLEGDAIELTAALSEGNGAITYQWYKGGTAEENKLIGQTAAKLEIASCVEGDAGDYYCVASKSDCSDAVNADAFTITVAHNPCATYFWFFNDADQTPNGKANATSVFSNMVGDKSNMNGSITIDEVTYNVTKRSDDADPLGGFTVPANKAATFYALAVSSGSTARKIVLTNTTTSATYEADVEGGSDSYKRVQIDNIAPGTYTIGKSGGNTRLGMVALKVCDATFRTITLEYADGTTPDGSLSVLDGTAATRPADPTWAHHRFDGWYNGENPYDWSANVTGDLTLTAHWTQLYTITYAAGDGTATGDAPTQVDKAEGETFTVAANTFEVASKDFVKWNDGSADYAPGATYTVGTANVVLTAQWKALADKYTVKFMDGETELGTKLFEVSTNPSDADIDKTKALNTFAAWQKEGEDIALDNAFWATVAKDATVTLTARWAKTYATSYDMEAYAVSDGASLATLLENLTAAGYAYTNVNGIDNGHTHNYIYDGMKYKTNDGDLSFNVNAGKLVIVKTGNLPANALTMYINGVADPTVFVGANEAVETHVNNYFYSAVEALYRLDIQASKGTCAIKAVTITDPFTVSFDANGGDDIAAVQAKPSFTLPEPTNGEKNFKGWYDAATEGNKIGDAGEEYTPTKDIKLYAQWEAISTDTRIKALTYKIGTGEEINIHEDGKNTFDIVLPYANSYETITVAATPRHDAATIEGTITQPTSVPGTATFTVVAQDGSTKQTYTINFAKGPKDAACIFKAELTSATAAEYSGIYADATNSKINLSNDGDNGYKFSGKSNYIQMALTGGTFAEGDILHMTYKTAPQQGELAIYNNTTKIVGTSYLNSTLEFPVGAAGLSTLYIRRTDDNKFNGWVSVVEVTRIMNPMLTAITFDGVPGVIDEAKKKVTVELPFLSDVASMAVEPTIAWNAPATTNSIVVNDGNWVVGDNTYVLTDKDGDQTTYTITLTQAAASTDATLATLIYNGTNITLEADQYNYEVELPKGTVDVPTITYTTNNAGATVVKTDATVLPGTTKIIVTAEDGTTQEYTINFTVSTSDIITIFDGSTMSDIATSPSGAISWEIVGSTMGAGDKNISYNDVTYTRALSCGNSSATKHLKIVVADNNKAQFEIIGMSNSSSDTRHAWLTNSTDKGEFANAIAGLTSNGYNPAKFTTDWLEEGTYYLHSDNTVAILLIRVKAEPVPAKCEAPTISGLADVTVCDLSSALLDGAATVSDGGTVTYKWYAEGDAETVLATTATYAPTTVGNYYVVATNSLADHRDNSTTSSVVVVRIKTAPVITTEALDQHAEAGNNVTLSVVATDAESYQWYTCDDAAGTNPVDVVGATDASLEVTVTSGMSQYYKVIVSNTCGSAETVAKVEEWAPVAQADVTESITWDWTVAAMNEVRTEDGNTEYLMANVSSAVPNNENFRSDMLLITAQYANRGASDKFFQGTKIRFNTTIDGLVRVYYRSTGSGKNVEITINGISAGSGDAFQWSNYIEVPAGEVTIVGTGIGENATGLTRIQKIEFLALGHRREASWIVPNELGTVCLKDACIIKGAELYELQGPDENRKLVFDEIPSGELEAGQPYLFNATATGRISFYNKVKAEHTETAGSLKGMYGTFEDIKFYPATDQNIYYFSGHSIWAVKKNTADVVLPAYLCYVKMDEFLASPVPDANPAPGRRRVTLGVNGQQVATGVDQVQGDEVPTKMIINGQLFILRGEKMYDAQGKLVK